MVRGSLIAAILICDAHAQSINPFSPVPQLRICPTASANKQVLSLAAGGTFYGCTDFILGNIGGSISLGQTPLTTRGDLLTVNSVPALTRLGLGGNNLYVKSNTLDLVYSSLPASGTGSPAVCTNQAVTGFTLNADSAPTSTCATPTLAWINGGTAPISQTYDFNTNNIKNAALTGASNGNSVNLLPDCAIQQGLSPVTGSGTLFTCTIGANKIGSAKAIRVTMGWAHSGTNSDTVSLKFNSTSLSNVQNGTQTGASSSMITIYNQGGGNIAKFDNYSIIGGGTVFSNGGFANGITGDFTASNTLSLTATVSSPDTTTPNFWMVEVIY